MADNIQSKINKKNAKSQSGILNWIGSFFEGPTEYHKRNKRNAQKKAKQLITDANKENKTVSLTSLKKNIKEAVPLKGGRDFEKPIKPKTKNQPKDIGDAEDSIRKNRKKRKAADDGTVSPRLVGALSRNAKPSQVSRGPAELASDASERKRDRSRNEKGRDVISKSAGSKKEGIGTKIARALGDKRSEEEMTKTRMMNEEDEKEMGMNKGGAVKKKYGMREGGFTKRGGMYKKGY